MTDQQFATYVVLEMIATAILLTAITWIRATLEARRKFCPWCGERHRRQCEAQRNRADARRAAGRREADWL